MHGAEHALGHWFWNGCHGVDVADAHMPRYDVLGSLHHGNGRVPRQCIACRAAARFFFVFFTLMDSCRSADVGAGGGSTCQKITSRSFIHFLIAVIAAGGMYLMHLRKRLNYAIKGLGDGETSACLMHLPGDVLRALQAIARCPPVATHQTSMAKSPTSCLTITILVEAGIVAIGARLRRVAHTSTSSTVKPKLKPSSRAQGRASYLEAEAASLGARAWASSPSYSQWLPTLSRTRRTRTRWEPTRGLGRGINRQGPLDQAYIYATRPL